MSALEVQEEAGLSDAARLTIIAGLKLQLMGEEVGRDDNGIFYLRTG